MKTRPSAITIGKLKGGSKTMMKRGFLSVIALAFSLALVMIPGLSQAGITASGNASVTWDSNALSSVAAIDWTQGTGFDTRGSISGVQGWVGDPSLPDWVGSSIDGAPWGSTTISQVIPPSPATPIASGNASTTVAAGALTTQTASSSVNMATFGAAGVDISQAVLSGQFLVAAQTLLDIVLDYALGITLFNDLPGNSSAFASASVGVTLDDFDTGTVYAVDTREFTSTLTGIGGPVAFSDASANPGPAQLHISYLLQPGINYNFEVQASTVTAASVPEPTSLVLLISGLAGLGILRKRLV